jgi:hypothetical protein
MNVKRGGYELALNNEQLSVIYANMMRLRVLFMQARRVLSGRCLMRWVPCLDRRIRSRQNANATRCDYWHGLLRFEGFVQNLKRCKTCRMRFSNALREDGHVGT